MVQFKDLMMLTSTDLDSLHGTDVTSLCKQADETTKSDKLMMDRLLIFESLMEEQWLNM